jgi:hypothetical protein
MQRQQVWAAVVVGLVVEGRVRLMTNNDASINQSTKREREKTTRAKDKQKASSHTINLHGLEFQSSHRKRDVTDREVRGNEATENTVEQINQTPTTSTIVGLDRITDGMEHQSNNAPIVTVRERDGG